MMSARERWGFGDQKEVIEPRLPDHAEAFIDLLLEAVKRVRNGEGVPEVAGGLVLPVRIAARRV